MFSNDLEGWCLCLVDELRIEYVELVTLNNLGWRIIVVVMSLIIFIPVVTHLDTIEIAWLPGSIFVCPLRLRSGNSLFAGEDLLVLVDTSSNLSIIQCFGCL